MVGVVSRLQCVQTGVFKLLEYNIIGTHGWDFLVDNASFGMGSSMYVVAVRYMIMLIFCIQLMGRVVFM